LGSKGRKDRGDLFLIFLFSIFIFRLRFLFKESSVVRLPLFGLPCGASSGKKQPKSSLGFQPKTEVLSDSSFKKKSKTRTVVVGDAAQCETFLGKSVLVFADWRIFSRFKKVLLF